MPETESRTTSVTPIRVHNLTVQFGSLVALADVTLSFETGQSYAIVGQSGCGKSTLLRAICGLVVPSGGSITLGGQRLSASNVIQLRQRMGYVIQEGGLFPHMTAWENVSLMARHFGWNKERIRQRVDELADMAQLSADQLDRYPSELSGGQRQRVGIIRALMLDPDILLMDEPLGALDPIIRRRLQDDLTQIFDNLKKTVILVTHDLSEAVYLADQMILMCEGNVVQIGDLAQFQNKPASEFVREFVAAQRPLELGAATK